MATPEATLDASIARAASFLRERLRSGDYGLSSIGSDGTPRFSDNKGHIFVASFITEAMRDLFDEIDRTIVLVRIMSEEDEGRWGFSPPGMYHRDEFRAFHVDSDDTAYVFRTLQWLGVNRPPKTLLSFYREPERLFVTFDVPGPTSLSTQPSPRNNLLSHVEVNANVSLALKPTHFQHFINYDMLQSAQDPRGCWRSYFYPSELFGTLLALQALDGEPLYQETSQRALQFIRAAQNADGSWGSDGDAYETGLGVAALAGRPEHASAMQRGVDHLLASMEPDGSWKSDACIYEFHADESDVWRAYDVHRTYVTARCLTALRKAAGQIA